MRPRSPAHQPLSASPFFGVRIVRFACVLPAAAPFLGVRVVWFALCTAGTPALFRFRDAFLPGELAPRAFARAVCGLDRLLINHYRPPLFLVSGLCALPACCLRPPLF